MTSPYNLLDDLDAALRYWWLIVVLMTAGVILGWIIFQIQPPLYEARAEIALNVDLSRTGTLSDTNQDILINTTGRVMATAAIMDDLKQQAMKTGWLSPTGNPQRVFFIERKAESFILRVQHRNPQAALELTDRWSELALRALESASLSALHAEQLERYLDGLTVCLQQQTSGGMEIHPCPFKDLQQLQTEITKTGEAIQNARANARGLIPGIRFVLTQPAALLPEPVQFQRSTYLLAGALAGLVAALFAIHFRLPKRLSKRV
ncbi:MAG: hypothetical protein KatS3mg045_0912 [Bellilinea sp.]|nr:MAG: hypothetical protein KatS3mg045_0912 [Bellilinea sp.]